MKGEAPDEVAMSFMMERHAVDQIKSRSVAKLRSWSRCWRMPMTDEEISNRLSERVFGDERGTFAAGTLFGDWRLMALYCRRALPAILPLLFFI